MYINNLINRYPIYSNILKYLNVGDIFNLYNVTKNKNVLPYLRSEWLKISMNIELSEEFMREFKDKICWGNISKFQTLSENFIREFQNKVDWYYISEYQILSEKFIREFEDKVDWFNIFKHQNLSEDFKNEFKDRNVI